VVSEDLVSWRRLPVALYNDDLYDVEGVFSGSITKLDDGPPVLMYTCVSGGGQRPYIQEQCAAWPVGEEPELVKWEKSARNPVIPTPPHNYNRGSFRDPSSAWKSTDGTWLFAVAAEHEHGNNKGRILLYRTRDFITFKEAGVLWENTRWGDGGMVEGPDVAQLASPKDSEHLFLFKYSIMVMIFYMLHALTCAP
jgi:beta-fructofuranosidase